MKEIDIWRERIDLYDFDAEWNAGVRADHFYGESDIEGFNGWVRITEARP